MQNREDHDRPQDRQPQHCPIDEVLEQLLPDDLQFTVEAGQLVVADSERSALCLHIRLHRVADLLPGGSLAALAERIEREVRPTAWYDAQGNSTISPLQTGWLVVAADSLTHVHLDRWLNRQRASAKSPIDE